MGRRTTRPSTTANTAQSSRGAGTPRGRGRGRGGNNQNTTPSAPVASTGSVQARGSGTRARGRGRGQAAHGQGAATGPAHNSVPSSTSASNTSITTPAVPAQAESEVLPSLQPTSGDFDSDMDFDGNALLDNENSDFPDPRTDRSGGELDELAWDADMAGESIRENADGSFDFDLNHAPPFDDDIAQAFVASYENWNGASSSSHAAVVDKTQEVLGKKRKHAALGPDLDGPAQGRSVAARLQKLQTFASSSGHSASSPAPSVRHATGRGQPEVNAQLLAIQPGRLSQPSHIAQPGHLLQPAHFPQPGLIAQPRHSGQVPHPSHVTQLVRHSAPTASAFAMVPYAPAAAPQVPSRPEHRATLANNGPSPAGIPAGQTALSRWPTATHQRAKLAMLFIGAYFFTENLYPDTSRRDLIFSLSWAHANSKFHGSQVIRYDADVQKGLEKQVSNIRSRSLEKIKNIVQRTLLPPDATPQQVNAECTKLLDGGIFHYSRIEAVVDASSDGVEGNAQPVTYRGVGRAMSHNVVASVFDFIMSDDVVKTGSIVLCMPDNFIGGMPIPAYAYVCTLIEHALESLAANNTAVSFDARYQGVYNKWIKAANLFFADPRKRGRMESLRRDHLRSVCEESVTHSTTGALQMESRDTDDET